MIQTNRDHTYVYVKKDFGQTPEDFKKDLDQAVFKVDGADQKLNFDGKVEDVVLGKLDAGDKQHAISDIRTIAKSLQAFKAAQSNLDAGQKAEVEIGGEKWTGERHKSNPKAHSNYEYEFSNPNNHAQKVVFTDDKRVKLHTEASGGKLAHEVVGKTYFAADSNGKYKDDSIFYISESVRSK